MLLTNVTLEFARGARDAGLHASTKQLIDLLRQLAKTQPAPE